MSALTAMQAPASPPGRDDDLRRRFHAGDRAAFGLLVRPLLNSLYTFCLRVCGRPLDAEEVAQESLERALRAHERYDPSRPFRPWLFHIALNLCRDRFRTPWWRRVLGLEAARDHEDFESSALVALEANDDDAAVRAALMSLPPMYREAVALFHVEEMPYQEMAELLGVGVPALKQRVRRGREMLRRVLESRYPELTSSRNTVYRIRDDTCDAWPDTAETGG